MPQTKKSFDRFRGVRYSIFRLAIGKGQNRLSVTMKQDDDNGITLVYDKVNNRLLASASLNGEGTPQKVLLNF